MTFDSSTTSLSDGTWTSWEPKSIHPQRKPPAARRSADSTSTDDTHPSGLWRGSVYSRTLEETLAAPEATPPFFAADPAEVRRFLSTTEAAEVLAHSAAVLSAHFDGIPPTVRVMHDPDDRAGEHLALRMPTSLAVEVAYARLERFIEDYWIDHGIDAIVVDVEFV